MNVTTYQGVVENGRVRLLDDAALPDKTKVYVIVPGGEGKRAVHIRSPRLADPSQASVFFKRVEIEEDSDASAPEG